MKINIRTCKSLCWLLAITFIGLPFMVTATNATAASATASGAEIHCHERHALSDKHAAFGKHVVHDVVKPDVVKHDVVQPNDIKQDAMKQSTVAQDHYCEQCDHCGNNASCMSAGGCAPGFSYLSFVLTYNAPLSHNLIATGLSSHFIFQYQNHIISPDIRPPLVQNLTLT